jgi:hypothetical protein
LDKNEKDVRTDIKQREEDTEIHKDSQVRKRVKNERGEERE